MSESARANQAQIEYWNTVAAGVWTQNQAALDRQLEPLGAAGVAALAPRAGERVVDVGCGCGYTSLQLIEAVAPGGEVIGVDISAPMLAVARARGEGRSGLNFLEADAQTADLGEATLDAAFSRFGVMFFEDPAAAFANLRRSVRPGGRLVFVCWRPLRENLWMRGPMEAAAAILPPGPPSDPTAPGPFAFADPTRVRGLIEAGGWGGVQIEPHDAQIGLGDVESTLAVALRVGPLAAALREAPNLADQVAQAVRAFLAPHAGPQGVRLPAAVWIVTARRS
jgi:SAM-dependent methyltransferase